MLAAAHALALLRTRPVGETDLHRRDGKWFLYATVEAPEAPLEQPVNGFLGVDFGIVNIAASSDGQRLAGARLNRYRKRQQRLRARLQAKKTSSARRLLKERRHGRRGSPPTSIIRFPNALWPRHNAPGAVSPSNS